MKTGDSVAALRSLGPRYFSALGRIPLQKQTDVEQTVGPDGFTAVGILTTVAHDLEEIEEALRDVLHRNDVAFDNNPLAHTPADEPYLGLKLALERVQERSESLATLAEQTNASLSDWERSGLVKGGQRVSAWDLVQHAVAIGAHRLRLIEAILATI